MFSVLISGVVNDPDSMFQEIKQHAECGPVALLFLQLCCNQTFLINSRYKLMGVQSLISLITVPVSRQSEAELRMFEGEILTAAVTLINR